MATANTADAWRRDGDFPARSSAASRAPWPDRGMSGERSSRPVRTGPARPARPADRLRAAEARNRDGADFARSSAPRRGPDPARRPERGRFEGRRPDDRRPDDRRFDDMRSVERRPADRSRSDERRPGGRPEPRSSSVTARPKAAKPKTAKPAADGSRFRGVLAVLAMFLVTLAGAGVDSFVGIGLGLVTLVALVSVTALATLTVRRRDLLSVLVAPPLVFVTVAGVNIALAPSASFNLPTIATLLVRGFPTMAIATGVALVLGLIRLAARR
jgi:hypothetical protein